MPNWCANELYVTYSGPSKCPNVAHRALKQFAKDHLTPDKPESPLDLLKYNDELQEIIENTRSRDPFSRMGGFWGGTNWSRADFGYSRWSPRVTVEVKTFNLDRDPRDGKECILYEFNTPWRPFFYEVLGVLNNHYPDLQFELLYAESGCNFYGRYMSKHYADKNASYVKTEGGSFPHEDMIPVDADDNPVDDPDYAERWILTDKWERYQDVFANSG